MTATTPLINAPRRTEEEFRAGVPREECAEARASRLVTVRLTRDELTTLMHALEVAKDEAYKAAVLARAPRNPSYRPLHPDLAEKAKEAALDNSARVADLCDMVSDIWKENR